MANDKQSNIQGTREELRELVAFFDRQRYVYAAISLWEEENGVRFAPDLADYLADNMAERGFDNLHGIATQAAEAFGLDVWYPVREVQDILEEYNDEVRRRAKKKATMGHLRAERSERKRRLSKQLLHASPERRKAAANDRRRSKLGVSGAEADEESRREQRQQRRRDRRKQREHQRMLDQIEQRDSK